MYIQMYIPPWLQKRYGVNGAKITGIYICESKKLNLFIFTNAPKQNKTLPQVLIITQKQNQITHSFWKTLS